jgi:hypothetical protein
MKIFFDIGANTGTTSLQLLNDPNKGCVETAQNHLVKLYENQKYVLDDMLKFLIKHNFSITNIISNDRYHNELNVYFKKN